MSTINDSATVLCSMLGHYDLVAEHNGRPAMVCARCGRLDQPALPDDEPTWVGYLIRALGVVVVILLLVGIAAVLAPPAGATTSAWQQPYGGCKEAHAYSHSQGAIECRRHGWIIRPRLVVSPARWVRYVTLPHCRNEDGSGQRSACTWNLGTRDGNGRGRKLWNDEHDVSHYVRGIR